VNRIKPKKSVSSSTTQTRAVTRLGVIVAISTALGIAALSAVAVGAVGKSSTATRSTDRPPASASSSASRWVVPHDQVGAPVVQSAGSAPGGTLLGVSCPTVQECIEVGSNSQGGIVSTSNDGGTTWKPGVLNSGEPALEAVDCASLNQCVAVGQGASARSIDGGATWSSSRLPTSNTTLLGVSCPNTALCVGVGVSPGNAGPYAGQLLVSNDGGSTWTVPTLPVNYGALGSVSCPSSTYCVAVGASILVSNDGGQTWTQQTVNGGTGVLRSVSCQSATTCVAIGGNPSVAQNPTASAFAVTSSDGGATWTSVAMPPGSATLSQISCSSSVCQAAGSAYNGSGAPMYLTSDGGAQWNADASVDSSLTAVNAVSCSAGSSCVFVGTNGAASVAVSTVKGVVATGGPATSSIRTQKEVSR
jgi:photosystem II stability/assembly factor-like uncharacterized protein